MSEAQTTIEPTATHGKIATTRTRAPISAAQRAKLSAAQFAYTANDPRWPEHRRKLAAAQEARRMTLFPNEIQAIVKMREKGRTFSYISEEIGVSREVIRRELWALGIDTSPVKSEHRAPAVLNANESRS